MPLVLALHCGGTVTPYFSKPFLVNLVEPALRKLGAIIVAPDCTAGRWTEPQAETDVLVLLDHVRASWAIDPARTLITGFSMGGMGTWALAARHQSSSPRRSSSREPQEGSAEVAWRIPLYLIHSRNDEVVPLGPRPPSPSARRQGREGQGGGRRRHPLPGAGVRAVHARGDPLIERAWKK